MSPEITESIEEAAKAVTPSYVGELYDKTLRINRNIIANVVRAATRELHEDLAEQAQLIDALQEEQSCLRPNSH